MMLMTAFYPEEAGPPNDITVELSPNSLWGERERLAPSVGASQSLQFFFHSQNMKFKWEHWHLENDITLLNLISRTRWIGPKQKYISIFKRLLICYNVEWDKMSLSMSQDSLIAQKQKYRLLLAFKSKVSKEKVLHVQTKCFVVVYNNEKLGTKIVLLHFSNAKEQRTQSKTYFNICMYHTVCICHHWIEAAERARKNGKVKQRRSISINLTFIPQYCIIVIALFIARIPPSFSHHFMSSCGPTD